MPRVQDSSRWRKFNRTTTTPLVSIVNHTMNDDRLELVAELLAAGGDPSFFYDDKNSPRSLLGG